MFLPYWVQWSNLTQIFQTWLKASTDVSSMIEAAILDQIAQLRRELEMEVDFFGKKRGSSFWYIVWLLVFICLASLDWSFVFVFFAFACLNWFWILFVCLSSDWTNVWMNVWSHWHQIRVCFVGIPNFQKLQYPPVNEHSTRKWMVGILASFSDNLFSGRTVSFRECNISEHVFFKTLARAVRK